VPRFVLFLLLGIALVMGGSFLLGGTSDPDEAELLQDMIERLDGRYNLRVADPGDVPRISREQALERLPALDDRRVKHVVLARADVLREDDVLVWAIEYWGQEQVDCSPILEVSSCSRYRTVIAMSLMNAMSGEGYGFHEVSRPVGPSFSPSR
jgi:hypothetical protein